MVRSGRGEFCAAAEPASCEYSPPQAGRGMAGSAFLLAGHGVSMTVRRLAAPGRGEGSILATSPVAKASGTLPAARACACGFRSSDGTDAEVRTSARGEAHSGSASITAAEHSSFDERWVLRPLVRPGEDRRPGEAGCACVGHQARFNGVCMPGWRFGVTRERSRCYAGGCGSPPMGRPVSTASWPSESISARRLGRAVHRPCSRDWSMSM